MSKNLALILIMILAISSSGLLITKPAHGQSIPTPSVPQFTVEFVNASYAVTTTNPYTGVNETQQISNNSIEVTIKNQPFDYSNNQIYYNIRVKPHFADTNWTEVYPLQNLTSSYNGNNTWSFAQYISRDSPTQSSSSDTIVAFPVVTTEYYGESGYDIQRYYSGDEGQEGQYFEFLYAIPANAQIDFQVEALVGHASQMWVIEHPFYPEIGGHFAPAVAYDLTSSWSNTQTTTIGETSASPTPTPTIPEFSSLAIQVSLITMAAVAGLLVYFKMHKGRIKFNFLTG
jgi:hypothetical protein